MFGKYARMLAACVTTATSANSVRFSGHLLLCTRSPPSFVKTHLYCTLTLPYTYVPKVFSTNVKAQQKHIKQDVVRGLYLRSGNSYLTMVISIGGKLR